MVKTNLHLVQQLLVYFHGILHPVMVKKLKGIQLLATVNLMQIELITIFDCTYCITSMSTIKN